MPSFQCIGGGSVPPPMACRTLGRAARRKARCLALAEAPILFFSVVLCWQNFKICECLLAMPSFQCTGGGSVPPPMPCRTLGQAARLLASYWRRAKSVSFFGSSSSVVDWSFHLYACQETRQLFFWEVNVFVLVEVRAWTILIARNCDFVTLSSVDSVWRVHCSVKALYHSIMSTDPVDMVTQKRTRFTIREQFWFPETLNYL